MLQVGEFVLVSEEQAGAARANGETEVRNHQLVVLLRHRRTDFGVVDNEDVVVGNGEESRLVHFDGPVVFLGELQLCLIFL